MISDSTQVIEVRSNNLFANGYLVFFPEDNEGMLIREQYSFEGGANDQYHTLKEGEKLYQLAYKYYSGQVDDSSKYWGLIADANMIHNPFDLSEYIGKDLLIPDIQKVKLSN